MPPAVISVASGKGGVGKTTSVANLSVALARQGLSVLAWDVDGQGNLGQALGIDMNGVGPSSYHLMSGRLGLVGPAIRRTDFPGVSMVPAHMELFAAEQELTGSVGQEFILRTLVQQPEAQAFDVIIFDLPPNLGYHTANAFAASRWVLIPLQVSGFALSGLRQMGHAIRLGQAHLNPELELLGLLPTFVSSQTNFSRDLIDAVHMIPETRVFQPYIPYTVRVAEGSLTGVPVVAAFPGSAAAGAYAEVAGAVWETISAAPAHVTRASAPSIPPPTRAQPLTERVVAGEPAGGPGAEPGPPTGRRGLFGWLQRPPRPVS